MFLKNDKIVVTLKNVTMRSYKLAGVANQLVLDPTAIVGWTDGTTVRRDATPRATYHGDFREKATMSARVISLSGTAIAGSPSELQNLRDTLMGILADGGYTSISVSTSADTRYSTVGLEGTPSWTRFTDTSAVFKIDLYAPDPYLYGPEKIFPSGANAVQGGLAFPLAYPLDFSPIGASAADVVTNAGNVTSYPTFKVTGDYFSGFSLTDTLGNFVKFDGMVTYSSPVTISMGGGYALQNGIDKTTLVSRRDWFGIPPGEAIAPLFTPIQNGSGWCDIIYRDTWI